MAKKQGGGHFAQMEDVGDKDRYNDVSNRHLKIKVTTVVFDGLKYAGK